jgi:hypothetical protein
MSIWDANSGKFANDTLNDEMIRRTVGKNIPVGSPTNEWMRGQSRRLRDLFDVVVHILPCKTQSGSQAQWATFLEAWTPIIHDMHLIIINGDPSFHHQMPVWLDYELYTQADIDEQLGTDAWLFNIDNCMACAYSFASLVADRDYVYFLDMSTVPVKNKEGLLINPIEQHVVNLLTPSLPHYYNPHDQPYGPGHGFIQGYPYFMRKGVPTVISMGPVLRKQDTDAIAQLAGRFEAHVDISTISDTSTTIGFNQLFSLSVTNLAIKREEVAPIFYFATSLRDKNRDIGETNMQILSGWFIKTILDNWHLGVKHGGLGYVEAASGYVVPNPIDKLAEDLFWLGAHEDILHFVTQQAFDDAIGTRTDDPENVLRKIANYIGSESSRMAKENEQTNAYEMLDSMVVGLNTYESVWLQYHVDGSEKYFVSSQSTYRPNPKAQHQCAVFTIMHEERVVLPVWLRYYTKHFPGAVFVVEHIIPNTTDTILNRIQGMESDIRKMPFGDRATYWKLFGDSSGFPAYFLVDSAAMYTKRLLRMGYPCVVYTDTDEFLAPQQEKYPLGLIEYMSKFQHDDTFRYRRATNMVIVHVSKNETGSGSPPDFLEKGLDWTENIMAQRSYYSNDEWYNKPLLTKVPMRWQPGFHHTITPKDEEVLRDDDFFLIHMQYVDFDYCLEREERKYQMISKGKTMEKDFDGMNFHIWSFPEKLKQGLVCRYARCYMETTGVVYDAPGQNVMQKLGDEWKEVVI